MASNAPMQKRPVGRNVNFCPEAIIAVEGSCVRDTKLR